MNQVLQALVEEEIRSEQARQREEQAIQQLHRLTSPSPHITTATHLQQHSPTNRLPYLASTDVSELSPALILSPKPNLNLNLTSVAAFSRLGPGKSLTASPSSMGGSRCDLTNASGRSPSANSREAFGGSYPAGAAADGRGDVSSSSLKLVGGRLASASFGSGNQRLQGGEHLEQGAPPGDAGVSALGGSGHGNSSYARANNSDSNNKGMNHAEASAHTNPRSTSPGGTACAHTGAYVTANSLMDASHGHGGEGAAWEVRGEEARVGMVGDLRAAGSGEGLRGRRGMCHSVCVCFVLVYTLYVCVRAYITCGVCLYKYIHTRCVHACIHTYYTHT
jgi:hypothetical protein